MSITLTPGFHRRFIDMRLLAQYFLALLAVLFIGPGYAKPGPYGERADQIMRQAIGTAQFIRLGNLQQAEQGLGLLATSVGKINEDSRRLLSQAEAEHEACMVHVTALSKKIGDIYQNEQATQAKLDELAATLEKVMADGRLLEAERALLSGVMASTSAAIEARRAKLQELERWWWVPGYGAYLAIRTLVDGDAEKLKSLRNTLQDTDVRIRSNQARFAELEPVRAQLQQQKAEANAIYKALDEMRSSENARLRQLKSVVVVLGQDEQYLEKVRIFAEITAKGYIEDLQMIMGVSKETFREGESSALFPRGGENINQIMADYDESMRVIVGPLLEFSEKIDHLESVLSRPQCPSIPSADV